LLATLKSAYNLKKSRDKLTQTEQRQKHLSEDLNKPFSSFIGESLAMKKVLDTIKKVASTDASILILGENGTGKELVAREIHRQSKRKSGVLMSVDLGSITETLFESELFGYAKGAFTDAKEARIGRFEAANGGSLFLDEIGNLTLALQAKLLTAIERKEISPVGSNQRVSLDIRLISATNKNLNQMVGQELFRDDLLYRLNTIQIELPPLRDREGDIILLATHFLNQFKMKYEKPKLKLNRSALEKLQDHSWPGNIREMMHTMEKAVILSDEDVLSSADFSLVTSENLAFEKQIPISLEEGEKQIIVLALKRCHGNISEAAKALKIGRQTLYRKIEKYGL
jgi:DNA-binding NtrC family response regulator